MFLVSSNTVQSQVFKLNNSVFCIILFIIKSCIMSSDLMVLFIIFQVAVPDVVDAAKDADILIFVVPHQFIRNLCSTLLGKIKPTAAALSLIKVCRTLIILKIKLAAWISPLEQIQALLFLLLLTPL